MKAFAIAALLLLPVAAWAASPEDAYLAARDRDIAALAKIEDSKDSPARDAQYDTAAKDLEQKLKAIIGPIAIGGFPANGKLNLDTLYTHDEGFGMLDGIVYGETESAKSLVVTTESLLDAWLRGHRDLWSDNIIPSAVEAVTTEAFYTKAVSTDAAVLHYADIPVAVPPGATFVHVTLSARTQDATPRTPDRMFVVLERGDRVFIVDEKLATHMSPIAACDAVMAQAETRAATVEKAYVTGGLKDATLPDQADKFRSGGEMAYRACYGDKVKDSPAFKAAMDQATAIVAALNR